MKFLDKLLKRGAEEQPKKPADTTPIAQEAVTEPELAVEKAVEDTAPVVSFFDDVAAPAEETATVFDSAEPENTAKDFVVDFLRLFGSDAEIESVVTEPTDGTSREKTEMKIDLTAGSSPGRLIGKHGETLDALQRVISAVVNRRNKDDFIRIRLDVDGYRTKRETQLREMAQRAADRAKKIRRPVSLESMNSYERHIIHEELQNVSEISTHSSGTEPNRHVVVSFNRGGHYDANR